MVRNKVRRIGCARVSAPHQHLDGQITTLRAQHCDQVFREKASGEASKTRPQLETAIDALGIGNVLVSVEWDRATRSMLDGLRIIERMQRAAKARGASFGRKPKLNERQRKEAVRRLRQGEGVQAVARTFNVHHATVSRLRQGA
jgi:DNA invertase Pin-like site-specific DNA recombinase